MKDGYIHYGDSQIDHCPRSCGAYRAFADNLEDDPYSVRLLNHRLQAGETTPEWIEVNPRGGVALPDDIDKFVVSGQELVEMKDLIPIDKARAVLNAAFAGKIEYR